MSRFQTIKIFLLRDIHNWSEEIFIIKKIKNTMPWEYVISDLNGEETVGSFYEKELILELKK